MTYQAQDTFGNPGVRHTVDIDVDKAAPVIRGLPERCTLWPPDGRLVRVAGVSASDAAVGPRGSLRLGDEQSRGATRATS